jgi:putative membrane protein
VANGIALYISSQVLLGHFMVNGGIKAYIIAGIIFGILNVIAKPILKILSLPFVLLTAGLFTLVINMFLVWFGAYALHVLDFKGVSIAVEGGWTIYLYAGLIITVVNMVIHWVLKKD